jgi:hypothetical protein
MTASRRCEQLESDVSSGRALKSETRCSLLAGSLRMAHSPRPPRSVEGDWMLSGSAWNARDGSTTPKPMAHFRRGRYQDAGRCAGRYWQVLGYLALKLDQTPACKHSALTSGFHRLRSTYNGLALYPPGASGILLSPLSPGMSSRAAGGHSKAPGTASPNGFRATA